MTARQVGLAAVLWAGAAIAGDTTAEPPKAPPAAEQGTAETAPACNSCDARHQNRQRLRPAPPAEVPPES